MPSTSGKQRRFMNIAAHDAAFAKKAGISQTVAREFNQADRIKARRKAIKTAFDKVKRS